MVSNKPHGEELKARQNFHGVHNRELDLTLSVWQSLRSFRCAFHPLNQSRCCLFNLIHKTGSMHKKQWSSRPSLFTNERLTDICVVMWSHRMSVTWLSQQSGLSYRRLCSSMEYTNLCHNRFTWYITSKELDKVTGICCWKLFQLLTCSNVQICTSQPFIPCVYVICCRWLQNTALQVAVQKDSGGLAMKEKLCCFLFYYTFIMSGTWSFTEKHFLAFLLQIWQGHLNTALYSVVCCILPVHSLNRIFFFLNNVMFLSHVVFFN